MFNLKVIQFKPNLIKSVNKLIPSSEILSPYDLNIILMDLKSINLIYPFIGSNLEFINKLSIEKKLI